MRIAVLAACLLAWTGVLARDADAADRLPNIVIVFADDLGYADIGPFGATSYETPHLDRMAQEGMKFTNFYVAQAVCGASRAALLTGCYANRIGMLGAPSHKTRHGIHPDEVLISEIVKQRGYATAAYGKWHLGHHKPFLPLQNGFDDYFGLPYSNDMWPYHPENPGGYPDLPLLEGNGVANPRVTPDDQKFLTTWYTERAVGFIEQHRHQPFFVYLAHSMPHVPLFVSEKFAGKTERGLFGDVISEVDWSVGQVMEALRRCELDRQTLVIFTSDNGPWLSYGNHAGSAGPLREGKGTMWDGGVREPCVMWWPGHIPEGQVCHEVAATIDILPTIAGLIDVDPPGHPIDGLDIWPLMSGRPDARSPHESYLYFWGNEMHAIRQGPWKLHFPHSYRTLAGPPGADGHPGKYRQAETGLALYDLSTDIGEQNDVAAQFPEVVSRLEQLADAARQELGDSLTGTKGSGYRPPAQFNE